MADQKVSDLPSLNGADVDPADLLYIVDSSAGTAGSKKITIGQFQLSPWSAGTVNGVVYFDGSKVPASSSALTFDGSSLNVAGGSIAGTKFNISSEGSGSAYLTTGYVRFVNAGGETARIDASGNLGIGTATPSTKLSVLGGASGTDTRATIGNLATALQVGVDSSNNAIVATTTANNLGLYTNNLERVTIDSVGTVSVGINSNPNGYKFHVYATGDAPATGIFAMSATTPYGMNIYYGSAAPNNSNANTSFLYCNDTSTLRIQLASNGGVINYQANNSNLSDRREKKDFAPAKSYLGTICAIPVQTFKYIDQTDDAPNLGVVAQDVQAVAPELVMESNWGTEDEPKMRLSIYQTDLQYALMKSIQELKAALDAANARIAALEAK